MITQNIDESVIEIDGGLICVRHNKKVKMIIVDNQIPFLDTLCCTICLDKKPIISYKMISLKQAQSIIKEKVSKIDVNPDPNKEQLLKHLQTFSQRMMNAHSLYVQKIDEIFKNLENVGQKLQSFNLIRELEKLYQNNKEQNNFDEDQLQKTKRAYLMKIDQAFQKLLAFDEFTKCFSYLKSNDIPQQESADWQQSVSKKITSTDPGKVITLRPITYQLITTVKQSENSEAIAFNNQGSIMVATCDESIKMWRFNRGNLVELQRLIGHTCSVYCLVFSSLQAVLIKESAKKDWISSQSQQQHTDSVTHLILNKNEDQLISCSWDRTIKVWNVSYEQNQIKYNYTLENRHSNKVQCISLNESETALVSCSTDKLIILWVKGSNEKWKYKSQIAKDDYGYRICFINDNQIAWQQCHQGLTHILEIQNENLIQKSDLKITLKKENDDQWLFPTIFIKSKQVMIQRHNQYVYIIRKQSNGQFAIESEPIDCSDYQNYGALTEDGQFIVIWNKRTEEFRVYKISY